MFSRLSLLTVVIVLASSINAAENQPRLILQITIDQLRGDLIFRSLDSFGKDGFRYLIDSGVVYRDAHHNHANNETIVGHTTLATGATPAIHGMIGNNWIDKRTGQAVYNIEDANYRLLTSGAGVDQTTEIDPTQKAARSEGRSPLNILTSTFSDELATITDGKARIFGVSVKDRGAVSMAGHSGKAFWFSKSTGKFVTSSYYYDSNPTWVEKWNATNPSHKYDGLSWKLSKPLNTYLFKDSDDRAWEADIAGFGRTFPHAYGGSTGAYYSTLLTLSPAGDELTLEFAKALIDAEDIGQDSITDYLSISFSSTDYVGHVFGPSSLEAEDNLLRLDRTLADLFAKIEKTIGLDNTLIVLSADHGSPNAPGYSKTHGIPAGYINTDDWNMSEIVIQIKTEYRIEEDVVQQYLHPYLYLSSAVKALPEADMERIQRQIANEIEGFPNVAYAIPSIALNNNSISSNDIVESVRNNYNENRSGDIYIVFEPNWFINDFDGLTVASTHGSPWQYDSFVPIIFAGASLTPQNIYRRVLTTDIARTLSAVVGANPPSGSKGDVLLEVLKNR
jgi:predicted AlkP superfamily pyrophosphatase or phosphodiesterase